MVGYRIKSFYPTKKVLPTTDFVEEFRTRPKVLEDMKKNITPSELEYKECWDRKAKTAPLRPNFFQIAIHRWPSRIKKPFPQFQMNWSSCCRERRERSNEIFIVRKLNSNETNITSNCLDLVTDLLSVSMIVCIVVSHRMWMYSRKTWYMAKNYWQNLDISSWAGETTHDPNTTGANVFLLERSFRSSFSSIMSA